ncbi:MAG: sulfite exporter TauE/SafE family protein [Gammaproteobacteria bacterium]|nr:sulfite exporter TauE/SafE family protein [Gammaproteobacteria bacterium]MDH3467373.1 sulfite exporter TauE/SafE family protein [Gammaproteobacteria bacterium]
MFSVLQLAVLIPIGVLVGLLIGMMGVGGVLLVPSLAYLGGVPVHTAIVACMASYTISGIAGAMAYARRGSIRWDMALWVCGGAVPGAYLGAILAAALPAEALELIIAALIVFAGIDVLRDKESRSADPVQLSTVRLLAVGAITGIGSAMSGTGGPLLLVPLLLWMNVPILTAIGLSQVIQVPIALMATAGNVYHSEVNFVLAAGIAALMITGVIVGARVAHRLPTAVLKRTISLVLIVVGAAIVVRLGFAALNPPP